MMRSIRLTLLCSALLATTAALAAAQLNGTLSGPKLGYLWSSSDGSLHPLLGIPGSSTIGVAQNPGVVLSQAFALDGTRFIASSDSNSAALSLNLATSPATIVPIAGAPAQPWSIAASRSASTAALYYPAQQRVLIVTGLPAAPKVAQTVDVSSLTQDLARMAVSDDGTLLLYSVSANDRDALYGWSSTSGHRLLAIADAVSDIAIAPNGTVIVADGKANEIFSVSNPKGSAVRQVLNADTHDLSNPTGVTVTNAGLIYVANAGASTITTLDASGRLLRAQSCSCALTRFFPLKDSLYGLSDKIDSTLYLLEAGPASDRILFVPPGSGN
jgi:hypothetical protein